MLLMRGCLLLMGHACVANKVGCVSAARVYNVTVLWMVLQLCVCVYLWYKCRGMHVWL